MHHPVGLKDCGSSILRFLRTIPKKWKVLKPATTYLHITNAAIQLATLLAFYSVIMAGVNGLTVCVWKQDLIRTRDCIIEHLVDLFSNNQIIRSRFL